MGVVMNNWGKLTPEKIRILNAQIEESSSFVVDWQNTRWAADLFWKSQEGDDTHRKQETWHHLVMSVGNFKRQAPISLLRATVEASIEVNELSRPESCKIVIIDYEGKEMHVTLHREQPETWSKLEGVRGLQTATITTLLSAIWPGEHIVLDIRDLKAAYGLCLDKPVEQGFISLSKNRDPLRTLKEYVWLRNEVKSLCTSSEFIAESISVVEVERALYRLDQLQSDFRKENKQLGREITWVMYAAQLNNSLDSL
jgi:hypothetical protein